METAAFIPIKKRSTRVPNKNFREFLNNPLYEHFFQKLYPEHPFDSIHINTDSKEVKDCAKEYGFNVIDRPPYLSEDGANGNDLLLYDADQVEVDVYFQLFVTAPLLSPKTIQRAAEQMKSDSNIDSLFTVNSHNSFFWQNDEPLNYDPAELPRTQDLEPVVEETTGLYAIERESLLDRECRIGYQPGYVEVDDFEAIDIDEKEDLVHARVVAQNVTGIGNNNGDIGYDLSESYN